MKKFISVAALLLLVGCSDQKEETLTDKLNSQFSSMSEMAELGTVEYTITKIVKASDEAVYKFGNRKIIFSSRATMKAGIDLAEFSRQNVSVDEKTNSAVVTLPKPGLLSFNMPPEDTHVVYQKIGMVRSNFSTAERLLLLTQGERAILNDIDNLGILADAEENASQFFVTMLTQVGFENITVKFQ